MNTGGRTMPNSAVRLAFSQRNATPPTSNWPTCSGNCGGSCKILTLTLRLQELQQLDPAHVEALDLMVQEILHDVRRKA